MKKDMRTGIEVPANIEEFDTAQAFVEELLERASASREIVHETMLVFETVFSSVLMQEIDHDTIPNISAENRLGSIYLKISYEGKRFTPPEEDDGIAPELRLLEGYADKVSYSYRSGYNTIRISMHKSPRGFLLLCGVGILVAIAAYAIINTIISPDDQRVLLDDYVFPLERLFTNAMLMVGAPVTFFSLLKNTSDAVIVSERTLNAQMLHLKSMATSVFAILLALGLSFVVTLSLSGWSGYGMAFDGKHIGWTFAETVVSMVPASIVEPFAAISPIPLIVVALLVTYALISAGRDFDALKNAIDICYRLFSRMLSAVMVVLPVASFLAVLDILLRSGLETFAYMLAFVLFAVACTCVLFVAYAVRLKVKGVKIGSFIKNLLPLLRENSAIGSAIDAAPYNVRYCVKHYGLDRSRLSRTLPVLAQINRDGNCFLLILIAALYIFATGMEASTANIVVIAVMALFLSFGAPNQPGSILIGTLFIVNYLNSYDMICMAIYMEVFLGGLQNMINVIGDIVMVMEDQGEASSLPAEA